MAIEQYDLLSSATPLPSYDTDVLHKLLIKEKRTECRQALMIRPDEKS